MATRITIERRGRSVFEILDNLTEAKVRKAVAPLAAIKIQALVKKEFAQQRDPYGKRWVPKKIRDGRPTLTGKTRQLRRNINKLITSKGFGLHAATEYASFHQSGTRKMPQRRIFPDVLNGLPRKWKAELRPIVAKAIKKLAK